MILLYVRLAFATAVVLAPGWLVARALGVRSAAGDAGVVARRRVRGARDHIRARLDAEPDLVLLLAVGWPRRRAASARVATRRDRGRPARGRSSGARSVGLVIWVAAPTVQGDGLFHLARMRKLLDLGSLSLDRVSEFSDGSLHPGYAFPLWHGFVALIAKVSGEDPERVVMHLPSILAALAVVVAFEAGWALFRRTWAAGATAGGAGRDDLLRAGSGGAYVFLSLPATAARQLLVPAALALALECIRAPTRGLVLSTAAAGFVLAVVHPTYAIFLWIPFVGFLAVRALWERKDLRPGALALGALVVPAVLFLLWLRPIVNDTRSVSPDTSELHRAFVQYAGSSSSTRTRRTTSRRRSSRAQGPSRSRRSSSSRSPASPPGVAGPPTSSAARSRSSRSCSSRTSSRRSPTPSRSRRRAALRGSCPSPSRSPAGWACSRKLAGPLLIPLALGAGMFLQIVYPGDFEYVLQEPAPAWIAWFSVRVRSWRSFSASRDGARRSRCAPRSRSRRSSCPSIAGGLLDLRPTPPPAIATLSHGLVDAVRKSVPAGGVVYSDPETSFRLAAFAPVYIAVGAARGTSRTRRRTGRTSARGTRAGSSAPAISPSRFATAPSTSSSTGSARGSSSTCRSSTGMTASRSTGSSRSP